MSAQKGQLWVILAIVFLGFMGISIPYLIFPSLFLNPEYSILPAGTSEAHRALFLGVTLAVYPLAQFVGAPILGALSDDYGRKPLLSGSLFLTALGNVLTGVAIARQHLGLLIVSRVIAGLMEGNVAIARAMAADIKTIPKDKSLGKVNAAISIAYLIGPLVGGLMTDKNLWQGLTTATPFYLISVFFVLSGLSTLVLKESVVRTSREVKSLWQRIHFLKRMATLFSNKQLKFLILTCTLFTLAADIFFEFGPVYLTVKWNLAPAQLILYNGVLCIGLVIGNGWLPSLISSGRSNRLAILCAMGGFALFLLGIVWANTPLFMMAFFALIGLAIGLGVTLLTVKISDSASDAIQGEVLGTQMSLRVLGDGLICLFGGVLLILSAKLILLFAAVLSGTAVLYL